MNLTNEQKTFIDFVSDDTQGNAIIRAVPGSGKTYTSILSTQYRNSGSALFTCYNKSIQVELEKKLHPSIQAVTLAALGHRAIKNKFKDATFNPSSGRDGKTNLLVARSLPLKYKDHYYKISQVINGMKRTGVNANWYNPTLTTIFPNMDEINIVESLIETCDNIPIEDAQKVAEVIPQIYTSLIEDTTSWDFAEQGLFPILYNIPMKKQTYLWVDEAQDLSPLDIAMLQKLLAPAPQGRIFIVGDPMQSIYAFRGADSQAMERLKKAFNATNLSLNTSFRCPEEIVAFNQNRAPHMKAIEGREDKGQVSLYDSLPEYSSLEKDNLILCRVNSYLIKLALEFVRNGAPFRFRKDISKQIEGWLKAYKTTDLSILIKRMENKIHELNQSYSKGDIRKAVFYREIDKIATLDTLVNQAKDYTDIAKLLKSIINADGGPLLSTVHGAKGLEARTTYIIAPKLMPLSFVETETEDYEQELNIKFVAQTRSNSNLIFIRDD